MDMFEKQRKDEENGVKSALLITKLAQEALEKSEENKHYIKYYKSEYYHYVHDVKQAKICAWKLEAIESGKQVDESKEELINYLFTLEKHAARRLQLLVDYGISPKDFYNLRKVISEELDEKFKNNK